MVVQSQSVWCHPVEEVGLVESVWCHPVGVGLAGLVPPCRNRECEATIIPILRIEEKDSSQEN